MTNEQTNDDTLRDAYNVALHVNDVVRIDECDDDNDTMTTYRIDAIDATHVTITRTKTTYTQRITRDEFASMSFARVDVRDASTLNASLTHAHVTTIVAYAIESQRDATCAMIARFIMRECNIHKTSLRDALCASCDAFDINDDDASYDDHVCAFTLLRDMHDDEHTKRVVALCAMIDKRDTFKTRNDERDNERRIQRMHDAIDDACERDATIDAMQRDVDNEQTT